MKKKRKKRLIDKYVKNEQGSVKLLETKKNA
jgi:hypothetical protein